MLDWTRRDNPNALRSINVDECMGMCKQCFEDIPVKEIRPGVYQEEIHVCSEG